MAVNETLGRFILAKIEMQCHCKVPSENLALAVTGSIPQLGNWNLEEALIAEEVPMHPGKWVVEVKLPIGTIFHYKWVVVWRDSLRPFAWEDVGRRLTHIRESGIYICGWETEAVFQAVSENSAGFWSHLKRAQNAPPRYVLFKAVYNFIKRGIVWVCSWIWQKVQRLWRPPPPPPPPPHQDSTIGV
ncbi:uncharacterized protein LOC134258990 [Saccostrea cucullata]|uniref:uncharacterized protein LOC134258990 n=1 Tax=Saccostrea cuccullata TaxID=36930 RepID=UPI002ED1E2FC